MSTENSSTGQNIESLRAALSAAKFSALQAESRLNDSKKAVVSAEVDMQVAAFRIASIERDISALHESAVVPESRVPALVCAIMNLCVQCGYGHRQGMFGLPVRSTLFASFHGHVNEFSVSCHRGGYEADSDPTWRVHVDLRSPLAADMLEGLLLRVEETCAMSSVALSAAA